MPDFVVSSKWIEMDDVMSAILYTGFTHENDRVAFRNTVAEMMFLGEMTQVQIRNHFKKESNKEKLQGYRKLTASNLGDPDPPRTDDTGRRYPGLEAERAALGLDINTPIVRSRQNPPRELVDNGRLEAAYEFERNHMNYGAPPPPSDTRHRVDDRTGSYGRNPRYSSGSNNPQSSPYTRGPVPRRAPSFDGWKAYYEPPKPKPSSSIEQATTSSRGSPPSSHGDHGKSLTKSGGESDRRERRR